MMPDPSHIINSLPGDVCLKFLIQLIGRTGIHEILPHQQSQFITDVKEIVIGIITSTPDSNAVMICPCSIFKESSGSLFRNSAQKIIFRNIVSSHRKNFNAVHLMCKAVSPLVTICIYCHGSKADPSFPCIQFLSSGIQKRDLYPVERLLPISSGPPEFRVFDHNTIILSLSAVSLPILCRIDPAIRICNRNDKLCLFFPQQRRSIPSEQFQSNIKIQRDTSLFMLLHHIDRVQPAALYPQQSHIPKNTGIGQSRPPVPSEHTVCLSKMGEALHTLQCPSGIHLLVLFLNISGGRMKHHL